MDDLLGDIASGVRGGPARFAYLDLASKVETLALASFFVLVLASHTAGFPIVVNFAVTLLALLACRSRSELQLNALVGFVLISSVTDIVYMAVTSSGWGLLFCLLNLPLKGLFALACFRLSPAEDSEELAGSEGFPTASYHAPTTTANQGVRLPADEPEILGAEGVGDSTRYRAV
jgi:hypothetical protein